MGLWTLPALLVGVSVIVAVPVAGLVAALVVPNHFYTPAFRKAGGVDRVRVPGRDFPVGVLADGCAGSDPVPVDGSMAVV